MAFAALLLHLHTGYYQLPEEPLRTCTSICSKPSFISGKYVPIYLPLGEYALLVTATDLGVEYRGGKWVVGGVGKVTLRHIGWSSRHAVGEGRGSRSRGGRIPCSHVCCHVSLQLTQDPRALIDHPHQ